MSSCCPHSQSDVGPVHCVEKASVLLNVCTGRCDCLLTTKLNSLSHKCHVFRFKSCITVSESIFTLLLNCFIWIYCFDDFFSNIRSLCSLLPAPPSPLSSVSISLYITFCHLFVFWTHRLFHTLSPQPPHPQSFHLLSSPLSSVCSLSS